jgi:hypothetical protein
MPDSGSRIRPSPLDRALSFRAMSFLDDLKKHLSPDDFDRMTKWMAGLGDAERVSMMRFIAERETKAPTVGEDAPDFELPLRGSRKRVRLSSFRAKWPVALIFGSYT